MSLNTSHTAHQSGVLIYSGERILIFYDGIKMEFDMEGSMPHFKGTKKGRAYLTSHRVIFNNSDIKDTLQSFSMPFTQLREVDIEQPIFGANYLKSKVNAEQGGNWSGSGKVKMHFTNGGCIEFGQCLLEAGRRATKNRPACPPAYSPMMSDNYYQAPPPAYAPPSGPNYGFIPYGAFPNAPPANSVFMTDAPPPYPGIDSQPPPYMQPTAPMQNGYSQMPPGFNPNNPSHVEKSSEAQASMGAQNAYYDPNNPHNVYMPSYYPPPGYNDGNTFQQPPNYESHAPPPYDSIHKKQQ